jgi:hypothetical protein
MNDIVLEEIKKSESRAIYFARFPEEVNSILRTKDNFFIELPGAYCVEQVPDSVLTIPFVGTMLGVAMCFGCNIRVKSLDKEYYNDVIQLISVFRNMYPRASFNIEVISEILEDNAPKLNNSGKSSLFFTGGVDATSAMIGIEAKKPILINIWGGDVPYDDDNYHKQFIDYLEKLKETTGVSDYCFIKSNCRILVNEPKIDSLYRKSIARKDYHGYWSSIAHIVAMTAIMAPFVYEVGIDTHYIGSSYRAKGKVFRGDGNSEEIISQIHYLGCRFVPQDSDITRVQKAERIVKYQKQRNDSILDLRVCWYRNELGKNCSCCEKCMRSIMEIAVNGGDPNDFGFEVDHAKYNYVRNYLANNVVNRAFWESTKDCYISNVGKIQLDPDIDWISDIKFNSLKAYFLTAIKRFKRAFNR